MFVLRPLVPLLLVLAVIPAARAQVNVEKLRDLEADGFAATLGGDVAFRSGNSDLVELGLGSRLDFRSGLHYTFAIASLRYGENNGRRFKDQSFAHLRYTYWFRTRLAAEMFGQAERDGFTLLELRLLYGNGVRLRYLEAERAAVYQGSTVMIEYEDLDASRVQTHPDELLVGRWSNYLSVRLALSEHTSLINTLYVQPRFDAFADVRVLDEAAVEVALSRHVALRTTFHLRYDSRPPDGVEDLDLTLRNGLTFTF